MTAHIPESASAWPFDATNTMPPRNPNGDDDGDGDEDEDEESEDNEPAVIREPNE
jgi:hypothetical protein